MAVNSGPLVSRSLDDVRATRVGIAVFAGEEGRHGVGGAAPPRAPAGEALPPVASAAAAAATAATLNSLHNAISGCAAGCDTLALKGHVPPHGARVGRGRADALEASSPRVKGARGGRVSAAALAAGSRASPEGSRRRRQSGRRRRHCRASRHRRDDARFFFYFLLAGFGSQRLDGRRAGVDGRGRRLGDVRFGLLDYGRGRARGGR
mmetsp:Transcript_48802/g.147042  ORF Transcript_48802/g.147042 Transcript_48802/m.147042 type:complete len:207 (+) Transcript_48802:1941-2561(+)